MPELPEVEFAAGVARMASQGKRIAAVRVLHPSLRRALSDTMADSLVGDTVATVLRRGKHQLLVLGSGRTLYVHFRMTGDWQVGRIDGERSRFARLTLDFADGTRLALEDARALAVVSLHEAGVDPLPDLGPEATAADFNAAWLADFFQRRRTPIKPILLDQRLVAGIGNIYASESLWYAKVDPRRGVHRIAAARLVQVVAGVKRVMRHALEHRERYYGADGVSDAVRFNVYDRAGDACRRCRTPIVRIVQAGRSTYYCPSCQR